MLEHRIFHSKKERDIWYHQVEYYTNELKDKAIKKRVLNALDMLKNEFGKGFLKSSHIHHPLYMRISNKAEFSTKWVVWFSESLQKIKSNSLNYNELKAKLVSKRKSIVEGVPFLVIANWLSTNRSKIEFEPKTNINKKADLKIFEPTLNFEIYIEVTTIDDSRFFSTLMIITQHIQSQMIQGLNYSGQILKEPNSFELEELLNLITNSIKECYALNEFVELSKIKSNGFLKFGFSPLNV